jgi:Kef-type K+ transport system membrane component KefB
MHITLALLLPLAAILAGTRIAAVFSQRFGLPAVFGELCFGFLVGPAVLNWIQPSETMQFVADLGVIILMFLAGLETDMNSIRSVGKASLLAATGGVILPLIGGYALGIAFGMPAPHALFLGAVLTATSVSVSAQTLRELGKLRTREGATIISAAIIDDVLGVIVFAAVMSLNAGGNLLFTIGRMAIFLPVAWFAGNWLMPKIVKLERHLKHPEATLAAIVALLLVYSWAAEALGSVATITGAYILGAVVNRHIDHRHPVHSGTATLGYGFFIPIWVGSPPLPS